MGKPKKVSLSILDEDIYPTLRHPKPLGRIAYKLTWQQVLTCIDLWIDCPIPLTKSDIQPAGGEFDRGVLHVFNLEEGSFDERAAREFLSRQGRQEMIRLVQYHKLHHAPGQYDKDCLTKLFWVLFEWIRSYESE